MTVQLTSFKNPEVDAFLEEWHSIRQDSLPGQGSSGEDDPEENTIGIEADPDAIWLKRAGYGQIVDQLQGTDVDGEASDILLDTLPRKHEKVVRKRMNTLRSTLKKRQRNGERRENHRTDVRNLFNNRQTSPTKTIVTTAVRPLASPGVSPSPGTSPSSSPRASPTPSRRNHSPSHTTGQASASTQTSTQTARQPNSASGLIRSSMSLSDKDRHGIKIRSRAHCQSSDSGIVSRDSTSSNEFPNEPHSASPEPVVSNHRLSPPADLRVSADSPPGSADSPQEDMKLDFRTQQLPATNNTADHLPNFMVVPDALGITYISDLSPADMEKVRSVALVELTITFEDNNLPLPMRPRRQSKPKSLPENSVFGVPLEKLLALDQQRVPGTEVPLVLEEMLSYIQKRCIQEEGLLRVPGNASRLQTLKHEIDSKFNNGDFSFEGAKASDVCSLLKMFIRELPIPLLTKEYLPAFARVTDISDLKEQIRTLNLLVQLLPSVQQAVLKRILLFLEHMAENCQDNKMDLHNISMVMAPNLFMALPSRQNLADVSMAKKTSLVVKLLVKYNQLLWTVPGEMLRQVRYLNEIEIKKMNPTSVKKALKQMQSKQPLTSLPDLQAGPHIVKVKAPLYTRVCMAVDVTHGMTAGDIVAKLQKRSRLNKDLIKRRVSGLNFTESFFYRGPASPVEDRDSDDSGDVNPGEQFVFEVGGNIGSRCLAHDTDMIELYKANPHAEWIIKPRDWPTINS